MESHEVLKKAIVTVGTKAVASDMSLSTSLLYKWCEPQDSPDAGGADNPLDRVEKIYELTGDSAPIAWLCERANGFFVENAAPDKKNALPLLLGTQKILQHFSELLEAVSKSIQNDGKIDAAEADRIRGEWEELKSISEGFVVACEQGVYREVSEGQKEV